MTYRLPRRPRWNRHQWMRCVTNMDGNCGRCVNCTRMKLEAANRYIETLRDECRRLADVG